MGSLPHHEHDRREDRDDDHDDRDPRLARDRAELLLDVALGLVLGAKLFDFAAKGIRVAGVNVCDDRQYFVDGIQAICDDAERQWQLGAHVTEGDIDIVDGHVGAGYARSRPEELATIRAVCASDGIVLDPVYTGKAMHGIVTELARDPRRFGTAVAFVHTGGMFGLFAGGVAIV